MLVKKTKNKACTSSSYTVIFILHFDGTVEFGPVYNPVRPFEIVPALTSLIFL